MFSRIIFSQLFIAKKSNKNNNILATKDSNHCNLTTSKLCNESANLPKNKHYSYRNITQAAYVLYMPMDLFEVGYVM